GVELRDVVAGADLVVGVAGEVVTEGVAAAAQRLQGAFRAGPVRRGSGGHGGLLSQDGSARPERGAEKNVRSGRWRSTRSRARPAGRRRAPGAGRAARSRGGGRPPAPRAAAAGSRGTPRWSGAGRRGRGGGTAPAAGSPRRRRPRGATRSGAPA